MVNRRLTHGNLFNFIRLSKKYLVSFEKDQKFEYLIMIKVNIGHCVILKNGLRLALRAGRMAVGMGIISVQFQTRKRFGNVRLIAKESASVGL